MARERSLYTCSECGHSEVRWMGRCPQCGAWNSFQEESSPGGVKAAGRSARGLRAAQNTVQPQALNRIEIEKLQRHRVEPNDLNRVLGGGLVPGSILLLGGAPGVGKSTLLTMLARDFAKRRLRTVYLSAEESAAQVHRRAQRLGTIGDDFLIVEEPCLERVLPTLYENPPTFLVVDSIQAVYSDELEGIPGSVSQIRFCGGLLTDFARATDCAVALVGHVTKDGDLAGPRVLEHLVDIVLYFEPDPHGIVRMVRAFKNRFGATGELSVMEMTNEGLQPVRDASAMFLAGRLVNEAGSAVTAVQSGSRPFLVEVQALLTKSNYGTPARVVSGVDGRRIALLAAILNRKSKVSTAGMDIFVKVAGGLQVRDPAADLAFACAMASSLRNRPVPGETIFLGEVGLTGELRPAENILPRLNEAVAHGFSKAVVAQLSQRKLPEVPGLKVMTVRTLAAAIAMAFGLERVEQRGEDGV